MDKADIPPQVAALLRLVEITGSQAAVAARLRDAGHPSVSQQTISYWINNAVLLDPEWWPFFEKAFPNDCTRVDLRPDVFSEPHRLVG